MKIMIRRTKLLLLGAVLCLGGCAATGRDLGQDRQAAYQAYQEGEYALAAERFERLVESVPKDAELWFRLGNAHARSKNPRGAVNAYENALLRDPEMSKAWYNMGLVYLQSALKSFTDMENHVPADDPVGQKARVLREEVFSLLEGRAPDHGKDAE